MASRYQTTTDLFAKDLEVGTSPNFKNLLDRLEVAKPRTDFYSFLEKASIPIGIGIGLIFSLILKRRK
jgi:hypothetical protein